MSQYILDKAYRIIDSTGVSAHRVVVQGAVAGDCTAPAAANAGSILGVTVHGQTLQNQNVGVRKAGIAQVVAASAISVGAAVNIADTAGKVKAIDEVGGTTITCLGFAETSAIADGDLIEVFISLHERTV